MEGVESTSAGELSLEEWLGELELEEYVEAFREAGYSSLRFVRTAEINDILGEVKMKRPHVRVFTPAWKELVETSSISVSNSQRPESQPSAQVDAPSDSAESIGTALAAQMERLASMGAGRSDARALTASTTESRAATTEDEDDEDAPLVLGEPFRPHPGPSPAQSTAQFRAEITSRLLGEVDSAIQDATVSQLAADPSTPQSHAANRSLQAISSTIRSILATANATRLMESPDFSPPQVELQLQPEPEPALSTAGLELQPEPEPELAPEPELSSGGIAAPDDLLTAKHDVKRHQFLAGETIIEQGQRDDLFYYLTKGQAVVSVDGNEFARKHAGQGFGEHGVLWNTPRTATVKAVTECECLELDRSEYKLLADEIDLMEQAGGATPRSDLVLSKLVAMRTAPAATNQTGNPGATPAQAKPPRTPTFSVSKPPPPSVKQVDISTAEKTTVKVDVPNSNTDKAVAASKQPATPPRTRSNPYRQRMKSVSGMVSAVARTVTDQGHRMADIHKGWSIEHGFVTFNGASLDRRIRNSKARSLTQAQQGAFLKISGDPSLGTPFTSLPTLLDRQKRVRQLLAVLETFEQEWGLHMPPMIVSVTGNALPFEMRPKFQRIFAQALLKATQATGAWVTTGGTDAGVMKLVGDAMKHSHTPVVGVSTWGVIKGRQRLSRPSQSEIRKRILNQVNARNERAPVDNVKNVGTAEEVTQNYARHKAKSWADPQSLPFDVGQRITFIEDSGDNVSSMGTLDELGMLSHEGRPDMTLKYPYLRTGKIGRGSLGRWGPNHAIDTIVTRRPPHDRKKNHKDDVEQALESDQGRQSSSGLQVALVFRPGDQLWAIPGRFVQYEDMMQMSSIDQGQRLTGEVPASETDDPIDRARLAVRKVFELESANADYQEEYAEMFDEIFKKSWQTLVYRGYSDDPRNTNEAWVETSAWHLHCPLDLVEQLEKAYSEVKEQVMWMDVVVTGPRLEFQDEMGNKYELFASHRELIELAVFGNVLGNHDMPFEYDGSSREKGKSASDEIVHLNPNHSHYICVDDGSKGKFGVELNFRVEFETFLSCFDHSARRMGIAELTQHFTACMDESSLHIAGEPACSGKKSHTIELDNSIEPNLIPIVRTASDGKTKMEYTLKITQSSNSKDCITTEMRGEGRCSPDPLELQDAENPNLPTQFSLKGQDMKGIRVSDGVLEYYPTVQFDPLVTQYDVVVPRITKEITVTATLQTADPKDIKRTVPIVVLCYGGGPFTIFTLAASGEKPIIIVSGSLRAAQYIEDWCLIEGQKDDKRNDPDVVKRLDELQKEQARRSLRMDFAGANKTTYALVEEATSKPAWWDVERFLHALTKLGSHDYLHFFDINQRVTSKTTKTVRLNPMLPPLLDSIVKSAQVKQEVKLPLAIRLNHEADVKTLCDAHGIARNKDVVAEMALDSRLLVYAAFHDQGKIVERLLDAGFAAHNLDVLVTLEIQRELDRPKLVKEDQPPLHWVEEHFQSGHFTDQTELAHLVASRWKKVESKETVYRAISWNMVPTLPGWLMHVESTDPELWWPPGTTMQQLSCSFKEGEFPPNGLRTREFVVISPPRFAGKRFCGEDVADEDGGIMKLCFQDSSRTKDTVQRVEAKMQPLYKDNVTEWLPLQSLCKYRLPVSRVLSSRERQRVNRAFANWLGSDKPSNSTTLDPNMPMHDLHRIYWAIRSNRPRLAKVLMTRCSDPILAGLFSAQIYRNQKLPADFVPDVNLKPKYLPKAMRAFSESYACEILDNAEFAGSNSAFDSFIFYGIDEEEGDDYIEFVTKESDKIENTKVRTVLQLMGIDERSEVTNIDLALLANSKKFMTQNGVMQFLMKLWSRPSDNGNWVQRNLPKKLQIPRVKMSINLVGFAVFLGMYIYLLKEIPARGEEYSVTNFEVIFWVWAIAFALNESVESLGDFDTFMDYMRGRGNFIDFVVIISFLLALVSRIYSYIESSESATAIEESTAVDLAYGILCANFIVCCFRFLLLLAMFERIGVMVIIVGKIVRHDILPFMVFTTICIAAFEAAGMYFSWMVGLPHIFGYFFEMFSGIENDRIHYDVYGRSPTLPEWDRSVSSVEMLGTAFQFYFFLLAIVILMNLLIAMMADTYTSVSVNALAEYQMQFAKIVKEGFETTVLPVPLNALEHLVNRLAPYGRVEEGRTSLNWGRHYTWPASSLPYQLEMAMRKVQVKNEGDKAARKVREGSDKI